MKGFTVEVNFDDIVSDMFCDADHDEYGAIPTQSFSDAVKDSIVRSVCSDIKSQISADAMKSAQMKSHDAANEFIDKELSDLITEKLKTGEVKTRFNGVQSIDGLIEQCLSSNRIESIIEKHVETKANDFAKELKSRYDNIFAAKVVSSLSKQKMLSPEVSKMLLGDD